jgi:hypothetical protein
MIPGMRLLLALVLSLAVPITVLSGAVSQVKCEHMHAMSGMEPIPSEHANRMNQADHSQHLQHNSDSSSSPMTQCDHCSSGHCASSATGLSVGGSLSIAPFDSGSELISPPHSRTAVAHSIDLLRPPNLI